MNHLTPLTKILIALAIGFGAYFGISYVKKTSFGTNVLTAKDVAQTQTLQSNMVVLPDAPQTAQGQNVALVDLPLDRVSTLNIKPINFEGMAWNAQMALMYANGGINTTEGSLMAKNGVNVTLKRQDDCNLLSTNLIKFAQDYKNNPTTAVGTNFIAIMGDGAPAWLAGTNAELEKLGPEYRAQIICALGKSNGEDKFMAPSIVKDNAQNARGMVCATVLRDGDFNIVIGYCAANNIPVNVDEKTYDPQAMNFVNAPDFIDAANKYINGFKEERLVVETTSSGTKKTGEKKVVEVNCVSTWSPGDVNICNSPKGGLVSIVSTKEYSSQMPCTLIGISKYMQDNRKQVEMIIDAIFKASDQVKSYDVALQKAGEISAKVYGEKDGAYWVKYYKGCQQADKQGNIVDLGGSRVFNLADNIDLFGLNPGSANVYASVYKVFGDIDVKLYPKLIPNYPTFNDVVDMSFLNDVKTKEGNNTTTADKVVYKSAEDIKNVVSKKDWYINFEPGSFTLSSDAKSVLEDLYNQATVSNGLSIELFGATDNTGTVDGNLILSQQRANAVKVWLQKKSIQTFPDARFAKIIGLGQSAPVADNSTAFGRAKNRKVQIIQGN